MPGIRIIRKGFLRVLKRHKIKSSHKEGRFQNIIKRSLPLKSNPRLNPHPEQVQAPQHRPIALSTQLKAQSVHHHVVLPRW